MGWYRRTGATFPGGDLWTPHGCTFEGWFWRFTDVDAGRVVVVLLGINRPRDGEPWATAGIAAHPGGFSESAVLEGAWSAHDCVGAGDCARALRPGLRVELPDASIDVVMENRREWPRFLGGIGPGQAVPGLGQYWHPWLFGARVRGAATIGGETVALDDAAVYAEKNWGPDGFPGAWWWGQAQGFDDPSVGVAFAGGRTALGKATALVVWHGGRVHRVVRPIDAGTDGWRLRGGGIEIEGRANGNEAHLLPVPLPEQHRNLEGAARQHLGAEIDLRIRRRRGVVYEGSSALAGLERGDST